MPQIIMMTTSSLGSTYLLKHRREGSLAFLPPEGPTDLHNYIA